MKRQIAFVPQVPVLDVKRCLTLRNRCLIKNTCLEKAIYKLKEIFLGIYIYTKHIGKSENFHKVDGTAQI